MPVLSAPVDEELVKQLESDEGLVFAIDMLRVKLAQDLEDYLEESRQSRGLVRHCDELTQEAERLGLYP